MPGGEVGDGRRWHDTDEHRIHANGVQARHQCPLQHLARSTGVAADKGFWTFPPRGFAAQHHRCCLTETHDELRRHGVTIGHTTHTIGAKKLPLFL